VGPFEPKIAEPNCRRLEMKAGVVGELAGLEVVVFEVLPLSSSTTT
jgi:hypothetical protein